MDTFLDMLDAAEIYLKNLDEATRQWLKKSTKKVSCLNCTNAEPGCCYQKVFMPLHEAFLIARHIRTEGLDTPEFRAQLKAEGELMEGTERGVWFHEMRRPCIFLKGGLCSIYPIRPMACRSYFVVSPQTQCQPGNHDGIYSIDTLAIQAAELTRTKKIHKALELKETPQRVLWAVLPRVVLVALEIWDSDDYQQTIRSHLWPTEESIINEDWIEGRNKFNKLYQIRRPGEKAP